MEEMMKKNQKTLEKPKPSRPRRPPPLHQPTLEEAIDRLGLRGVTSRRMFGGLCYYANSKPFSILLGDALAVKLPAVQLRASCAQGDGRLFHPGGGDFVMREYLELWDQALMNEERVDAYVLASYRFIAGQEVVEEDDLGWSDLRQGREALYGRTKRGTGESENRRRDERSNGETGRR
jgi:TfoX/Sxy family transcriptional regulator of competence genes